MDNKSLSGVYNQIKKEDKIAFFIAMFSGVITHLYALTNKIPTFDDLMCLNSFGGGVSLGRWFLEILGLLKHKLFGNYSTPSINGFLAIFFIAIAVAMLCRLLEIKSQKSIVAIGVLMTVFPVVTGYMAFIYTAYYYCLALDLVTISAIILKNKKTVPWRIVGCFFASLAIGIYQSYLPFLITLLLCVILLKSINDEEGRTVLREGFRYLADLVLIMVIYFACSYIMQTLMHTPISAMKGGNRIGSVLEQKGLGIVPYIYGTMLEPIKGNFYGLAGKPWMRAVIIILYLVTLILLLKAIVEAFRNKQVMHAIIRIIVLLLLPLGIHSIYAMVEEQYFYTLMLYTDVMIFIIPIMLMEHISMSDLFGRTCRILCSLCIICSCFLYLIQDNAAYLEMELGMSAAKSYYTTLITQVKSLDDYDPTYPVVIVGSVEDPTLYDLREEFFGDVAIGGTYGTEEAVKGMYLDLFLKQYCGYNQNVTRDASGLDEKLLNEMPCYPKRGSIRVDDTNIIVKLSNNYRCE